jgi:hypothetical protein
MMHLHELGSLKNQAARKSIACQLARLRLMFCEKPFRTAPE